MKGKQYIEISESHTNFFQNVGISVLFWVTLPESSGPLKTVFQKLSADANPTGHSRRIFGYHQSLLILNRSQAILIRGVFFLQHEFPIATPTFSKHKIFHFSFLEINTAAADTIPPTRSKPNFGSETFTSTNRLAIVSA